MSGAHARVTHLGPVDTRMSTAARGRELGASSARKAPGERMTEAVEQGPEPGCVVQTKGPRRVP